MRSLSAAAPARVLAAAFTERAPRRMAWALAMLASVGAARAQWPSCLHAEAVVTPTCGQEPGRMRTPRMRYAAWKQLMLSGIPAARYLTFAGAGTRGEPLFQKDGRGEARTAQEWLASGAGTFFFDTVDARDPQEAGASPAGRLTPRITLRMNSGDAATGRVQGFAYFNAAEVRLEVRRARNVATTVREAGEPFFDVGLDLDGDGVICGERGAGACCPDSPQGPEEQTRCNELLTRTNSRWDVELDAGCDPRVTACGSDGPVAGEPWPPERPEWHAFVLLHEQGVEAGEDPRFLPALAHEPFLQWAPAAEGEAPPVLWSFARERRPLRAPATASLVPPPRAAWTAGYDRASESVELPIALQGMIYNEGGIVLGDGIAASGAFLSGTEVRVNGRVTLAWSSDFSRARFPPPVWKGRPDWCR